MDTVAAVTSSTHQLRGRMRNLRRTRRSHNFVFIESDRSKMGATAVAAGLAGLGGVATGLSSVAMDTTEDANLLEFDLDGEPVRAWVWESVFSEGDEVVVVAEYADNVWQGFGIFRPVDRVVALHPHCSRGRYAHYKSILVWTIKIYGAIYATMWVAGLMMMFAKHDADYYSFLSFMLMGGALVFFLYLILAYRISKKLIGFVRLAEGIFSGFGWSNVRSIDLPAITKKGKKPGEPAALGIMYFRYSEDMARQ